MHSTTLTYTAAAKPSTFDYFTERHYHQYVVRNCKNVEDNNCRLLVHGNGLCVLCLDESHAAVRSHRTSATAHDDTGGPTVRVASVAFGSERGSSKMAPENIRVVGKRKRNAKVCQEDTTVCVITMTDGTLYKIPACVNGFILELNPLVPERPEILVEAPTVEGFLAIISPRHKTTFDKYTKVSVATVGDVVEGSDDFF